MPKVSVIVPNYNYARYLPQRIDSILNQTFQDFELIILDDCSTDNSREVIERYRNHPRVANVIYNDKNTGSPFKQWFKGLELAQGEYIWIAEADDAAYPTFLETLVKSLDDNPSGALAIAGSTVINDKGEISKQSFDRWDLDKALIRGEIRLYDGHEYLIHNLYWACHVYNASCVVFRKASFLATDYSPVLNMLNAGDWLFWSIMLTQGDLIEVRDKLSYLRRHDQTVTSKGERNGNLLKEDAKVVRAIEKMVNVGWYRSKIRHGEMIKKLLRENLTKDKKQDYLMEVMQTLGCGMTDFYLERINKSLLGLFPFLITSKTDQI